MGILMGVTCWPTYGIWFMIRIRKTPFVQNLMTSLVSCRCHDQEGGIL